MNCSSTDRSRTLQTHIRGEPVHRVHWLYAALAGCNVALADGQSGPATVAEPQSVLQEVVVTATRRGEKLTQVPASIGVFDAAALDSRGIRSAEDLVEMAPGVDISQTDALNTNISIRGISNEAGTAGLLGAGAATTGIYLDDTPVQGRSLSNGNGDPLPDVFDLERVEVLRGPQGTLFGSGSEGGAVRFISVQPSLKDTSEYGRAELAFTHNGGTSYDAGAAGGAPLIDGVLGFRVSAHDRHDGGFLDRLPYPDGAGPDLAELNSNYSDTRSVRAALLWQPTENLRITPSVYYRKTNTNDSNQYWVALSELASQRYVSGNGQNSPDTNTSHLASLLVSWTLGPAELISNTSYYARDENTFSDFRWLITNTFAPITGVNPFPGFATPGFFDNGVYRNTQDNWTQELRLQSVRPDARLSWVVGLFVQDARQRSEEIYRTPFLNLESGLPGTADDAANAIFGLPLLDGLYLYTDRITTADKQLAGFGEVNFDLTSHLRLTAGLRVARTEIDSQESYNGPLAGGEGGRSGKHAETPKTPKYSLSYRFDANNMVYATVADGFRLGGVNGQLQNSLCAPELASLGFASLPKTYNSDKVRNHELGAKIQPYESLRIATSVYYIDWLNIIQPIDLVNCGATFTTNLGKAVSKGADLDLTWAPVRGLLLDLMVNYNDAKFTRTIREPGATSNIVSSGWTLGGTPWTVVASSEYSFKGPFAWDSYLQTVADYRSSNRVLNANTDPESASYNPLLRPNPSTVDLRIRLGARFSGWDLSLFVNNATNNHPLLDLQNDSVGGPIPHAQAVRPLTVGMTVMFRSTKHSGEFQ